MDLVSRALYPGEGGDDADPVVELCDEVAASHLDRWLEVHDLVGDVELVLNGLQSSHRERERERSKLETPSIQRIGDGSTHYSYALFFHYIALYNTT